MEPGEERLTKYERDNLLIKLDKEFAYAGSAIPHEIEADGERIKLRSFVFEMSKKRGMLKPEEIEQVNRTIALIKKKRREIVQRIAREDISKGEAQGLFKMVTGLDRALDTLYSAPEPKTSVEEEYKRAKVEDGRRWLALIRRVYTKEEKRKRD
jgi:hypothetical protein